MGRHRHGPRKHGPARQPACPCLAWPAPMPVPGLPIQPMGQHGHGTVKWPGPLTARYLGNSAVQSPPDGLWLLDPGQRRRRVYKPAGLPRSPPTQTLNHFILSLANALPPLLSGSRPLVSDDCGEGQRPLPRATATRRRPRGPRLLFSSSGSRSSRAPTMQVTSPSALLLLSLTVTDSLPLLQIRGSAAARSSGSAVFVAGDV